MIKGCSPSWGNTVLISNYLQKHNEGTIKRIDSTDILETQTQKLQFKRFSHIFVLKTQNRKQTKQKQEQKKGLNKTLQNKHFSIQASAVSVLPATLNTLSSLSTPHSHSPTHSHKQTFLCLFYIM